MSENITTYEKYFFEFFKLSKIEFTSINDFFKKTLIMHIPKHILIVAARIIKLSKKNKIN